MSNVEVLLPSANLNPLGEKRSFSPPPHRSHPPHSDSESPHPPPSKKMRTRRRRKKKKTKATVRSNEIIRACKTYAPFNSNEYLMDVAYTSLPYWGGGEVPSGTEEAVAAPLLSPIGENEEEQYEKFSHREFLGTYQAVTVQRLDSLTKAQLVEEYIALDEECSELEQRLSSIASEETTRGMTVEGEGLQPGEVLLGAETAAKISVFRDEINALKQENIRLKEENEKLRSNGRASSSSGSSSSSSSSSSSGSDWSSSSDSDENDEGKKEFAPVSNNNNVIKNTFSDDDIKLSHENACVMDSGVSCISSISSEDCDIVKCNDDELLSDQGQIINFDDNSSSNINNNNDLPLDDQSPLSSLPKNNNNNIIDDVIDKSPVRTKNEEKEEIIDNIDSVNNNNVLESLHSNTNEVSSGKESVKIVTPET